MADIAKLADINWFVWLLTGLMLLSGLIAVWKIISEALAIIGKPIGWYKQRAKDHEMVLENTTAIKELAALHAQDTKIANEHDEKLREELSTFMTEVKTDIKTFADNRTSDRAKSFDIQKELSDAIKTVAQGQAVIDKQIEALMIGSMELLGNTIDERYEKYISLGGIPQNEIDEFDSIYEAYRRLNGNHGRQTKYEYVKNHLPVIPVKTELVRR